LANSQQARKRATQNTKRRLLNASQRSTMRTHIKSFIKAVESKEKDANALQADYRSATSQLDQSARRGLTHRNKAARLKSRLNRRLKEAVAES
jgi:small subunit ribosomal protein S20|tara:strand:- start:2938 stop:3216 length:279 start_codon:yes stop_codon:yes gene_type:complete